MNILDFNIDTEYLAVSLAESWGDYECNNRPIKFFRLGPTVVAQQMNTGLEPIILAPSKGAGYIANKKLARKIKGCRLKVVVVKSEITQSQIKLALGMKAAPA